MLRMEMHNGATVSDWLGTAMTAARVSALFIADVREGRGDAESNLRRAADEAAQALQEVCAVMDRLGYSHGYNVASFGSDSDA